MINVTKPFLPPYEEYQKYLRGIWERNWLTNNGPLVNELELKLKETLDVKHLLFVSNGTIAIQLALKALNLSGEIITTPFSYIATTSSLLWENCKPVFVDIDRDTWNIDAMLIEEAITDETTGILATHVFGNPCAVEQIEEIANKHRLKVIYDGAHAFGTQYHDKSLLNYGDISTVSFHATKLFHTIEGGAVIARDTDVLKRMAYQRNFGHDGPEKFAEIGINAKNSEFHAAMGLSVLPYLEAILSERKAIYNHYKHSLSGLRVNFQSISKNTNYNHSYFPILFETEAILQKALKMLNDNWIYPRRYFYPSLSALKFVDKFSTPVSNDISSRVLCLPNYHGLSREEIDFIVRILLRAQNN